MTVARPDGGMALWTKTADGIDVAAWERGGEKLDVLFRGARIFDFFGREQHFLRLGFTYHNESERRSRIPHGHRVEADPVTHSAYRCARCPVDVGARALENAPPLPSRRP